MDKEPNIINSAFSAACYSFWIDPEQAVALKAVKAGDGVPESEQIRRPALDALLGDATRRPFDVLVCWRLGRPRALVNEADVRRTVHLSVTRVRQRV